MQKHLTLIAIFTLSGCSASSSINYSNNSQSDIHNDSETSQGLSSIKETPIFYHYVNREYPSQAAALISGTFELHDNCLYLVTKNGDRRTPLFPEYPQDLVSWDDANKSLNIDGHIFHMGNHITTNGGYQKYVPNSVGGREYEKQGDKSCLTPTLVMVGTFDIKRN